MLKLKLILGASVCATALYFFSIASHASMISAFSFHSDTTSCESEIQSNCIDIFEHGLSGTFQVDLEALNASGNGWISWKDFLGFDATNSVSSWTLGNLSDGSVAFSNWMVIDLVIDAFPDFNNGWNLETDGGGESLKIGGLGLYKQFDPFSNASSTPGTYCPSNGQFLPQDLCPVEAAIVDTLGISAEYTEPVVKAVPAPSVIWLFGIGLIGLIGFSKRRKAA